MRKSFLKNKKEDSRFLKNKKEDSRFLKNKKADEGKCFLGDKKAEIGDVIGLNEIIFFTLNIAFFAVMFLFVITAGSRAFVIEETYAKQIALMIDNSKPEMVILLDVENALKYAEKNNVEPVFKINEVDNCVEVSLSNNGYSYCFYSDYDIDLKLNKNWLSIIIK